MLYIVSTYKIQVIKVQVKKIHFFFSTSSPGGSDGKEIHLQCKKPRFAVDWR